MRRAALHRATLRRVAALVLPLALVASVLSAVVVLSPAATPAAQAATTASASTSGFVAGNIISDATFTNTSTMTAGQIQSFLANEVVTCSSGYTCLKDFRQTTTTKAADSYCQTYSGASNEAASTIISKVATACGINPQVLIVLLQKEQGLVQSKAPSAYAYLAAVGYACPDTAGCSAAYGGFFNQIYYAAHQFQVYAKNPASFRYRAGYTNLIQYSPDASCGTASVFIQNQATASLYNYTPYTPNAAALAAGYGSAPCGAYGNRNFYLYFMNYFGNPSNWLSSPSFEGGTTGGWSFASGLNRAVYANASVAEAGNDYLAVNGAPAGKTFTQTVSRASNGSEEATATAYVRAVRGTVTGILTASGLGGVTDTNSQTFTAGTTWTPVTVTTAFTGTHTKASIGLTLSSASSTYYVDDASLTFGAAPARQNLLTNGSFDAGIAPWDGGNGAMNKTTFTDKRFVYDGTQFAAANTLVSGRSLAQSVPITAGLDQQYTFSVYLRSSSTTKAFSGVLALWALDGTSQTAGTTTYTVAGNGWTKVTATVDTGSTGATRLKAEVYLGTLGPTLWLDKASLSQNQLTNGSFEGSATAWSRSDSSVNWAIYDGTGLPDGSSYLMTNTSTAGSSLRQDVVLAPLQGSTHTASIWVKSATGAPVKGRLALWGLGTGAAVAASQAFTSTGAWTRVEVSLPIATTTVTSLRVEVYDDTVGTNLDLDSALLY